MTNTYKRTVHAAALTAIITATAVMYEPAPAYAQSACFERAALMKHLNGKFSEVPVAAGLAANGSVLEVFSSEEGNTWTIVLTQPNGATCIMASGEAWMGIQAPKAGTRS